MYNQMKSQSILKKNQAIIHLNALVVMMYTVLQTRVNVANLGLGIVVCIDPGPEGDKRRLSNGCSIRTGEAEAAIRSCFHRLWGLMWPTCMQLILSKRFLQNTEHLHLLRLLDCMCFFYRMGESTL